MQGGIPAFVRRVWWLLLLGVAVAAASASLVNKMSPRQYESTVRLMIGEAPKDTDERFVDVVAQPHNPRTYAELAISPPVLQKVITKLGLQVSPSELVRDIKTRPIMESRLLDITVGSAQPELAASLAEGIGEELVSVGNSSSRLTASSIRQDVQEDIDSLGRMWRNTEQEIAQIDERLTLGAAPTDIETLQRRRDTLVERIAFLQRSRTDLYEIWIRAGDPVVVVAPATVPSEPTGTGLPRAIAIAGSLGLAAAGLVGFGIYFLRKPSQTVGLDESDGPERHVPVGSDGAVA